VHIFQLNLEEAAEEMDDAEDDEDEISAAQTWVLPCGERERERQFSDCEKHLNICT
jgi:hypothetical protein